MGRAKYGKKGKCKRKLVNKMRGKKREENMIKGQDYRRLKLVVICKFHTKSVYICEAWYVTNFIKKS